MIELGKIQQLKIDRFTSVGAFLNDGKGKPKDSILLPKKYVRRELQVGDLETVFVYRDSEGRLIATTNKPIAEVGELAYLKVREVTRFGTFLDLGIEKDLFVPLGEQNYKMHIGKSYLVYIYIDKSDRLCATTDVAKYLESASPYQKGDRVDGVVYLIKEDVGTFVAVDEKYMGLIPKNELFQDLKEGDKVNARIIRVREDGKLDLAPRKVSYKQMKKDTEIILDAMIDNKGFLPLNDNSSPQKIQSSLKMSKSAFKRAIGRLLKENKIEILKDGIRVKKE